MKKYDITSSIVLLVLGILLLLVPGGIVTTVIRLFGVIILIVGVTSVLSEIKIKKRFRKKCAVERECNEQKMRSVDGKSANVEGKN